MKRLTILSLVLVVGAGAGCVGDGWSKHGPELRRRDVFEGVLSEQRARRGQSGVSEGEEDRAGVRSAQELIVRGDAHRSGGQSARAHLTYLRAHLVQQGSLVPLERIAYLVVREDPDRGAMLFRELIRDAPEDISLQVGLAYSQIAMGELDDARETLERALARDPESPAGHAALAVVQDRFGDHEAARVSYERAGGSDRGNAQLLSNLGVSQLMAGETAAAISTLERARALAPKNPVVSNNLGLALGLEGQSQAAFKVFQEAGTRGDALNNLGYVYYLRSDYPTARALFEQALLSNETDELRVLRNLDRLDVLPFEDDEPHPEAERPTTLFGASEGE